MAATSIVGACVMARRGKPPYHDGKVHVQREMCDTCVGHPGNRMKLVPGRLRDVVKDNVEADGALTCHQTTYGQADQEAVCRWFFDRYKTTPLQIAERIGIISFVGDGTGTELGSDGPE